MSVRGLPSSDPADACPFVAFEDERDERSTRPDHRHRCYAELRPAPRALAHQEAYCLSPSFATCPTFRDWAHRESARARPPARSPEARSDEVPPYDAGYGRRQSDWTAPPPWTAAGQQGADAAAGAAAVGPIAAGTSAGGPNVAGPSAASADVAKRSTASTGPGGAPGDRASPAASGAVPPAPDAAAAPGFLTARDRPHDSATEGAGLAASAAFAAVGPAPAGFDDDLYDAAGGAAPGSVGGSTPSPRYRAPVASPTASVGGSTPSPRYRAPVASPTASVDDQASGAGRAVRGPSWEQPRRYEAYPTLRTRVGLPSVPRIALGFVALLVAALALFLLPTLVLRPGGGGDGGGAPTASPSASSEASASLAPTPVPSPTAEVYVVVAGDTLSGIAKKKGVTIQALQAANPQIKNIDKLQIGDQLNIPPKPPSDVIDAGSPSASPSG